jgi:hypothetical protein
VKTSLQNTYHEDMQLAVHAAGPNVFFLFRVNGMCLSLGRSTMFFL